MRQPTACRFCRHLLSDHNLIQGCPHCTCAGTPGEGMPRSDAEDMAPISPHTTYGDHRLRRPLEPPPVDPVLADLAAAVREAVALLDSEEHRYVERYDDCPAGCRWEGNVIGAMKQVAGPEVCPEECFYGTIENEDAPRLDPLLERLRRAADHIAPEPRRRDL